MRTKIILSLILITGLSISIRRALAAEAAEGGKSLITRDMSGWKLKDSNNTKTWKIVSDVKLDANDPKKLVASGDAPGENPVLFRSPVDHGTDIYTERSVGDCEWHVEL